MRFLAILSMVVMTAYLANFASAGELRGVQMADEIKVDGDKTLHLNGMGKRIKLVFDVYVAGLYVEKTSKNPEDIINSSQRKQVLIQFVRDLSRDSIQEGMKQSLLNNCDDCNALRPRISKFADMMTDVRPRQQIVLDIYADKVEVTLKGEKKGTIEGADFAKNLTSVFIGKNPPNPELREGMLGLKK